MVMELPSGSNPAGAAVPSIAVPAPVSPQPTTAGQVRVELVSGRVFTAQLDAWTDARLLWLRWQRGSVVLRRPIRWDRVVRAQVAGDELSGEEFREAVETIRGEHPSEGKSDPGLRTGGYPVVDQAVVIDHRSGYRAGGKARDGGRLRETQHRQDDRVLAANDRAADGHNNLLLRVRRCRGRSPGAKVPPIQRPAAPDDDLIRTRPNVLENEPALAVRGRQGDPLAIGDQFDLC